MPKEHTSDTVAETVNKTPVDAGEIVEYENAYVPGVTHKLPKSEWDRLAQQGLLENAVFLGIKGK